MPSNPFNNNGNYNPIISVDGTALPVCPSSFEWEQEDLSNADAGRSEDGAMHKNRIGIINGVKLEFQNLPLETMNQLLTMFSPEYITVVYVDPSVGSAYSYHREEVFYVGNRTLRVKSARLNICEKLSFNIISRVPH